MSLSLRNVMQRARRTFPSERKSQSQVLPKAWAPRDWLDAWPAGWPTCRPEGQLASWPVGQPAGRLASWPTSWPAGLVQHGRPAGRQASLQAGRRRAGQLAGRQASLQASRRAGQPAGRRAGFLMPVLVGTIVIKNNINPIVLNLRDPFYCDLLCCIRVKAQG